MSQFWRVSAEPRKSASSRCVDTGNQVGTLSAVIADSSSTFGTQPTWLCDGAYFDQRVYTGEGERASVLCLGGIGEVGASFMYQESGPKKQVRAKEAT